MEKEGKIPPEAFNTPELRRALAKAILKEVYEKYPRFWIALEQDTKMYLAVRGETRELLTRFALIREAARLSWETDAFLGLVLYRARGRLLARDVPVLPGVLHKLCMALCQMCIGEPVVIEPGVYVPHGQIVVDGNVRIGRGAVLTPWVTIGLVAGNVRGPTIGRYVSVGTGAKLIGPIHVGDRAKVGANAVVNRDVAADTSVSGVPARPLHHPLDHSGRSASRLK
jgi:serine O-acetyltransferase